MRCFELLADFLATQPAISLATERSLVVAFSGGIDSTALLAAAVRWGRQHRATVFAAHLDHALDAGSGERARAAQRIAGRLGARWCGHRLPVPALRRSGESPESAARRLRYCWLEQLRGELGSAWILTAHHRDDQAETVLMRMLMGSGLEGLAAIPPRRGAVGRPLLALGRRELAAEVAALGLQTVDDPTNRGPGSLRNHLRHHLLPRLAAGDPAVAQRLAALAQAVRRARPRLEELVLDRLRPYCHRPWVIAPPAPGAVSVRQRDFLALPPPLRGPALALLHRLAGAAYPASLSARRELLRQLGGGTQTGCDCGGGWRWQTGHGRLILERAATPPPRFSYTVESPGEIDIPEVGSRFRIRRATVADAASAPRPDRTALALAIFPGDKVTLRNRLPGDRLQPQGRSKSRRLKEILIDQRVPRSERDRLPLLTFGDQIVWVPGVAIAHGCRPAAAPTTGFSRQDRDLWIAELQPLAPKPSGSHPADPPPADPAEVESRAALRS
jgi:tRNA(Ile)-lysidine synthase